MPKRGNTECIQDVIEAISRIERYVGKISYQRFLKDIKTQDAIVRNIEIIGEAVKNITSDFKKKHRNVDWASIAKMRDKLIHHYFGVNLEIVWDVAKNKLPELKSQLDSILATMESERKEGKNRKV